MYSKFILFILVERWRPRPQVKIVLGRSPLLMISCMEAMWPQPMYTSEWVSEAVNTHTLHPCVNPEGESQRVS